MKIPSPLERRTIHLAPGAMLGLSFELHASEPERPNPYNAPMAIAWATTIGLIAYYSGQAAADAIQRYGLYSVGALIVVVIVGWIVLRRVRRRAVLPRPCSPPR